MGTGREKGRGKKAVGSKGAREGGCGGGGRQGIHAVGTGGMYAGKGGKVAGCYKGWEGGKVSWKAGMGGEGEGQGKEGRLHKGE